MRKLIGLFEILLVLSVLLVGPTDPVYALSEITTLIDADTLSGVADTVAEDWYIADAKRVTFFVTYDQDGTTVAVTSNVTVAVSVDGVNWQDVSWYDVGGGVTPQTSEELTADATYVGWFDKAINAPYIRIRATSTGETGMSADITVTLVVDK